MSGGLIMDKYTSLYEFTISIYNGIEDTIILSNDDVVSISIINDYDYAFFPIMRLRLYIDLPKLAYINEDPNNLLIGFSCNGSINKINESEDSVTYTRIKSFTSLENYSSGLYGYVETKNNPYSKYDNYQMGEKRDDSLNTNNKVPLTIYCYDKNLIRATKQRVNSIYTNTSLYAAVTNMFSQCGINHGHIEPFDNNEIYDQILIPNMSLIDAISYLDTYYGLYENGSSLYSTVFGYMSLSRPIKETGMSYGGFPVRVSSYKAGNSFSGISDPFNSITYQTPDTSVVIKSQTDLEQTVNARIFASMNVSDFESVSTYLDEIFKDSDMTNIEVPYIIHKSKNQFIPSMYKARVNERNTRIDLSLNGYVLSDLEPYLLSFVFDNPIRGTDINTSYRPMYTTHTFTNIGSGLFDIQSTFQLC